jgi:hypothetical protein
MKRDDGPKTRGSTRERGKDVEEVVMARLPKPSRAEGEKWEAGMLCLEREEVSFPLSVQTDIEIQDALLYPQGENEAGSHQVKQAVDRLAHRRSIQPRLLPRKEVLLGMECV